MRTSSIYKKASFKTPFYDPSGNPVYSDIYWTMTPGARIINAVTGKLLPGKVGSKEEEQYFRVMHSCGLFEDGPAKLYFECIEDYEIIFGTAKDETVNNWRSKQNFLLQQK